MPVFVLTSNGCTRLGHGGGSARRDDAQFDDGERDVKRYMCMVCGFIYDEAQGWPDDGIPAGTKWEDVPDTWVCPECGVGKEDFEMEEF
jgi:rubredoxin